MADRVGQQLGNYRLTRLIGQGGFAEVYLGEHLYLKTLVAIKLLRTTVANPDTLESFLKEAQTIAHLVHPNIVRVMDFGVDGETPYLVMDYAVNGTLRQRHAKGTQLPLATIVSYVNQVAAALQHAHNEKLIHRDVKPENMLLGRYNDVLLSDFGIALIAQSSLYQSTQDVIGTIAYMSPEQIQGKPRPASDQYSLGIVVYEWLSGDRPFHGSFAELCTQHLFASPAPLREKVSTLAPVVEEVVLTVLAKDSHHRFSSVQVFAHALEQASQSEQARSAAPTVQATMPPLGVPPMGETQLSSLVPIPEPLVQPTKEAPPSRFAPTRQASLDTGREPTVPVASTTENPPVPAVSVSEMISTLSAPSLPFFTKVPVVTPVLQTVLPSKRGIPRRTVVVGLAGLVVVGIAGSGIVWLIHSQQPSVPVGTTLYTYRGHSGDVNAVAWSPDGKRLASGSYDGTVQVWDAADGGHVFTYRGHSGIVTVVAWSPDGKRLASGSWDKTVQVWDAADGGHVFTYRGHSDWVYVVAWSPDGRRLASGSVDATVQVWDVADGGHVFIYRGHSSWVNAVPWSPDGKRLASGSGDHTVQVWDAADGGHVFTYRGHSAGVDAVVWSPDGKRLASGSYDGTVQVWDAADGGHVFTYRGHSDVVTVVVWSPDGKRLASGSWDKTVQVWSAE